MRSVSPRLVFLALVSLFILVYKLLNTSPRIQSSSSNSSSSSLYREEEQQEHKHLDHHHHIEEQVCSVEWRFQASSHHGDTEQLLDCVRNGMTYLTQEQLQDRVILLESLSDVDGAIVEAGVALGGTAILATHVARKRPVHLYDIFGMIPPPEHRKDTDDAKERYSIIKAGKSRGFGNTTYYGYMTDVMSQVLDNYKTCKVSLECVQFHKGLVEETMKDIHFAIAYLHCDTDFYSAVYHCLVDGAPHVVVNGAIAIDDYFSYGSAQQAVEDYFTDLNDTFVETSRGHVYYKTLTTIITLRRVL